MSRIFPRVCAAIAVAAVLAPFSPASAEKWAGRDARGDVDGYTYTEAASEDECPTFEDFAARDDSNDDITRVVVRHTKKSIIIRTTFRDLDPALDQMLTLHLKTSGRDWQVMVDRAKGSPHRTFGTIASLAREPRYPDPDDTGGDGCGEILISFAEKSCSGLIATVDTKRDIISVTLPRACVHDPHWVRVGGGTAGFEYPAHQTDLFTFTGYFDHWDPAGTTSTDWLPPFGPRVHVRPGVVS